MWGFDQKSGREKGATMGAKLPPAWQEKEKHDREGLGDYSFMYMG